jgi:hypothetical protein
VPITRFTRIVLALDLVFSLVAGCVLYLLATRTDRYFAWTIKLPVTATFLGAGYLGAVVTLVLSSRATDWRRVRALPVMGITLTGATLLVTLWHLEQFHLGTGPALARIAAWTWLAVYVAIPVLLAAVFVRQERMGGADAYRVDEPLVPLMRTALGIQALGSAILGAGLVFWPHAFDVVWPWPLPPLSAGAVGAWLLTIAAASGWALREGDWARFRSGVPGFIAFLGLVVLGAIRYSEPLDSGAWQDWTFFAVLGASAAVFAYAGWQQERASVAYARTDAQAS